MRHLLLLILAIIAFAAQAQNLRSGGKLKPEQAIMDIRHYTIALDVDPPALQNVHPGSAVFNGRKMPRAIPGSPSPARAKALRFIFPVRTTPVMNPTKAPT
ncbi:MAG: hypothetical protein IPL50_12415 [Chitinophagaceae bacterium]|nr:hypothetical protein [Chitinophagaceae bacterium]